MSSRLRTALCALLVVSLVAGPVAGHATGSTAAGGERAQPLRSAATPNATTSDPAQILHVELRQDGDARWSVVVAFTLDNSTDTAAFEELAARFERGDSQYLSAEWFGAAAERASESTGRPMEVRNVTRSADIRNGTGRLVLSFTWTNFAKVNGETLTVGDAFTTTSGQWLGYLTADQTLYLEPPEGYGIRSRSGTPPIGVEDGTARWEGPVSFAPDGIRIVYAGDVTTATATPTPTPTPTPTTTPPTTTTPGPDGKGSSILPVVGVIAIVAALAAGFALRGNPDGGGDGKAATDEAGDGGPTAGGAQTAADESSADASAGPVEQPSAPEPDATADAAGDAGATAGGATAADETAAEDEGIDEELLSDEERVERLLERNGGRMKQANIVKETGWSNAKVSQLLSSMDEDGRIDKLRIGRENLISFPDEDVADFESE